MKRLLLVVAVALTACDEPIPGLCKRDSDCTTNICYKGICILPEDAGPGDAGHGDDASIADASDGAVSDTDAGPTDGGASDASVDGGPPKPDGGCTPSASSEQSCGDGIDNDCDAKTDCADPDCAGKECRSAAGECDLAATCAAGVAECPANAMKSPTMVCRQAVGPCDAEEKCTGITAACPPDAMEPTTKVCRGAEDPCDAADYCSGTSASCPPDVWKVDLTSDPNNCGTCGNQCFEPCAESSCVPDYEWARWPVPPAESPQSYTIGVGTVTDNVTKLVWEAPALNTLFPWKSDTGETAKTHCAKIGMRLPTLVELESIVDFHRIGPAISPAFQLLSSESMAFWTSTPRAGDSGSAWRVSFDYGSASYVATTSRFRVRCVR